MRTRFAIPLRGSLLAAALCTAGSLAAQTQGPCILDTPAITLTIPHVGSAGPFDTYPDSRTWSRAGSASRP